MKTAPASGKTKGTQLLDIERFTGKEKKTKGGKIPGGLRGYTTDCPRGDEGRLSGRPPRGLRREIWKKKNSVTNTPRERREWWGGGSERKALEKNPALCGIARKTRTKSRNSYPRRKSFLTVSGKCTHRGGGNRVFLLTGARSYRGL